MSSQGMHSRTLLQLEVCEVIGDNYVIISDVRMFLPGRMRVLARKIPPRARSYVQ